MAFRSDDALAYSLAVYFDLSIIGIGVFFIHLLMLVMKPIIVSIVKKKEILELLSCG
jgi:hypothetical protein